jgi:hypothetical protein
MTSDSSFSNTTPSAMAGDAVEEASHWIQPLRTELGRYLIGQTSMVDRLLISLLVRGHVLLEGVPGLAKTLALKTLAALVDAKFNRIQFTPDMLPADIVGTEIFDPRAAEFRVKRGPVFANFILADELNRAPAKVQSALLEAMQEKQVTIGDQTFPLATPFMVLATQNPLEQEGTYPLPEAQLDRFLLKVVVDYPSEAEELQVLDLAATIKDMAAPAPIVTLDTIRKAWGGEPFEYDGRMVRVTPPGVQPGGPKTYMGGSTDKSALRAAKGGYQYFPGHPGLWDLYAAEREALGFPPPEPLVKSIASFLYITDDPDRDWPRVAPHVAYSTNLYAQWASERGAGDTLYRPAETVEALKAMPNIKVLTPDQCFEWLKTQPANAGINFHALLGGLDPELSWASLLRFEKDVLPRLVDAGMVELNA